VENLGGWLTTVVARVCLNMLHSRAARRDDPVGVHVPDPVVGHETVAGPKDEALLSDSVGLALIVVLDTLAPAERLAFVLHDMFDVPFEEIAPMVGRSPGRGAATRNETRGVLHALFTVWVDDGKGSRRCRTYSGFRASWGAGGSRCIRSMAVHRGAPATRRRG
jgi:hypothetical protein